MDQSKKRQLVQSDWYSPRRLRDSPTQHNIPGDRFIPNRSLMNLDQAHGLLTNKSKEVHNSNFSKAYRQKLMDSLNLGTDGKPHRMLVFRGNPKSGRKSMHHIDEMQRDEAEAMSNHSKGYQFRCMPMKEDKVLGAPDIGNNYYANIIDWGKNNILAVALGSAVYLWNSENKNIKKLSQVPGVNHHPTSISWSEDARSLAVGYMDAKLQLWDAETLKCIRSLGVHKARVGTISWNGHSLTSGSQDHSIVTHDVRLNNPTSYIKAHTREVCGLKWSSGGNVLASGGNDNLIYIWVASKMSSSNFLYRFNDHGAAVKALAWCPHEFNVLASGGGTEDRCIKMWNTQKGTCIGSIHTEAQVSGLEWNKHHREILSGHGYGIGRLQNHLSLWKYPSMTKVGDMRGHQSRVLNLSQSPDGLTVVSAGADETLRFWKIFGPPRTENSRVSELDSLLSLKTSPIR